jgi:hypothetical protein
MYASAFQEGGVMGSDGERGGREGGWIGMWKRWVLLTYSFYATIYRSIPFQSEEYNIN